MAQDNKILTEAITTLSTNTARLSGETTALSVRVIQHQGHLENLLRFEETRQTQMDDHWREMTNLKSLVADITSMTTTQTQRISA